MEEELQKDNSSMAQRKMNVKTQQLVVGELCVHVTYKNIKNMYLRVRESDGSVEISAPVRMPQAEITRFVQGKSAWIKQAQNRIWAKQESRQDAPVLVPFQERELRVALKRQLQVLLEKWEPVMQVQSSGFTIKKMKTRWGSCNVKTGHLNFNFALAQVPQQYVEYVVVHELTHLLEPSHNARFWALMEQYLPKAKQLRKELNQFGT